MSGQNRSGDSAEYTASKSAAVAMIDHMAPALITVNGLNLRKSLG